MKALGINASARKKGNCHILLKEALKGLKDAGYITEAIVLDGLDMSPWREKNRKDDADKVIAKIKEADIIIFASPIYFGSLSAQAKIMIDRCQDLWKQKNLLKKHIRKNKAKAALICVEASKRRDFLQNAEQVAKIFFAVIEAKYKGRLFCTRLENAKDVLMHPEYLKKAYTLGKGLAY